MTRCLGVLVAGGRGDRLAGGGPKALARAGGMTLLDRAIAVLGQACDEVVVSAPAAMVLPLPAAMRADDPPGVGGPLAGVVAGFGVRVFDRALVLGVDFPLMRGAALAALRDRLGSEPAVVPAPGGMPQPLAAAYTPRAARELAARLARGERALTPAVLALGPLLLPGEELATLDGGLDNFFNLNTPGDLAEAERRLAAVPGSPA